MLHHSGQHGSSDSRIVAGKFVDHGVHRLKRAVMPEHDRIICLKMLHRRVVMYLLPIQEANGKRMLMRHVCRSIDIGA
eukprot:scaffold96719_cov28-Tisochrysis_lutea.AAC.2